MRVVNHGDDAALGAAAVGEERHSVDASFDAAMGATPGPLSHADSREFSV